MKLNKIFTSHMVFQAGKPIRIYGEGRGTVKVSFAGVAGEMVSCGDKWCLELPSMEYGGPYTLTVFFENEAVVLEDIYIGEVYLFAGQSNMQFKMQGTEMSLEQFESNDMVRLFSTDRIEDTDYFKAKDGWITCKKEEIKYWSAIAYMTANEISKAKGVAVGAIACYQGASVIESWVPKGTFQKIGIDIPTEKKKEDHYAESCKKWNEDGILYNYALSQVAPFALSSVVWYQGESDTAIEEARVYMEELRELINIWREDFGDPSLPFAVVQIADFDERKDEAWSLVQKAQLDIQNVMDNVTTIVSADVCESNEIHPKSKDKLSGRIAAELM